MAPEPTRTIRRVLAAYLSRRRALLIAGVLAAAWLYQQLRPPAALRAPAPWPGLVDVTVVEPGSGEQAHQTILINGDRIETVRPAGPDDPRDLRSRAFARRYVLPGLIDLSVRQPPAFLNLQALTGLMYLGAGVTTVRDIGNFEGDLEATQAAIDDGTLVFPRLVACGREIEGEAARCPRSLTVATASAAEHAVADLAAAGARCVHVRDPIPAETRAAITAAARSRQLLLVADAPAVGVPYVPTLAPWFLSHTASAPPGAGGEPFQHYLPSAIRAVIWPAQLARFAALTPEYTLQETLAHAMSAAVALHAAGTPLLVGSGAPGLYAAPGGSARMAIEALVSIGIRRADVWAAATRDAGAFLGIPQLGRIEPGAPADLLVFREDPMQRSDAMMTLEAVISRGRLYPSKTLLGQLLEHARYHDRWTVRTLRTLQARWLLWWDPASVLDCQLP